MASLFNSRRMLAMGLLLVLVAPVGALAGSAQAPDVVRVVVGFYEMPEGAVRGGSYQGASIVHADDVLKFVLVSTDDPSRVEARAREDPNVRYVELDGVLMALFSPNDTFFVNGQQYAPHRVNAPLAWDKTRGSTATVVCVIDSGVRRTHEDIASERYVGGHDYIGNDGDPNDQNGHGTFTTAIAVGRTNNAKGIAGIAETSWRHARVLDAAGSGSPSVLGTAMRWCADNGSHVLSMSLGTPSDVTAMRDGATYVANLGAHLVAATGNNNCVGSGCVLFPARYSSVIAVGATNSANNRWSSSTSGSNGGPEIDVMAPGESIVSAYISGSSNSAYATGSGTSAAAPVVAGALALLKSYAPAMSAATARAKLESTALDRGASGFDQSYGHGIIQIDQILPNSAPSITLSCESGAVTSASLDCTITPSDLEGHGVFVDIAWGDGTFERVPPTGSRPSGVPFSASHKYVTPGDFQLSVVPTDDAFDPASGAAKTANVAVTPNAAPALAPVTCSPSPSAVGHFATCTLRAADDSDGVAFTLDWGDGNVERIPATGYAAPGANVTAQHKYVSQGYFDVYTRAEDDASPALLSPTQLKIHEVRACSFTATGMLLAGAAGVQAPGVSTARIEGIPTACAGLAFSLTAQGAFVVPDVDVCWFNGPTVISCNEVTGNEFGTVPATTNAAEVILWLGTQARYTLSIPAV